MNNETKERRVYVVRVDEYEQHAKHGAYWRTADFLRDSANQNESSVLQEEVFDNPEDAEKLFLQTACEVSRSRTQVGEIIHYEVATLEEYTFDVGGSEKMSAAELFENYDYTQTCVLDITFPDNEYIDPTDMDYRLTDQEDGKVLIEFSFTYSDGETAELGAVLIDSDEAPTDYDESGALYEKYLA